ncbi:MAG: nucleotide exchange factor GrpE [Candidatus Cyclobacteriaceae bacterium M3_2C_046]
MSKEKFEEKDIQENLVEENQGKKQEEDPENEREEQENAEDPDRQIDLEQEIESEINEINKVKSELDDVKEKYLRIYSEYDNFRRRTAREKLELVKTANEDLVVAILPVIDDFERARKAVEDKEDPSGIKEGFNLIYSKLMKILEQKGIKTMEVDKGSEFDPDQHEAISQFPAPEDDLKGKVIDVIEKGYILGDKVVRFAKVVIGS